VTAFKPASLTLFNVYLFSVFIVRHNCARNNKLTALTTRWVNSEASSCLFFFIRKHWRLPTFIYQAKFLPVLPKSGGKSTERMRLSRDSVYSERGPRTALMFASVWGWAATHPHGGAGGGRQRYITRPCLGVSQATLDHQHVAQRTVPCWLSVDAAAAMALAGNFRDAAGRPGDW